MLTRPPTLEAVTAPAAGDPRILFLTHDVLGFRAYADMVDGVAEQWSGAGVVHVRLRLGRAESWMSRGRRLPGPLTSHARMVWFWRRRLSRWVDRHRDLLRSFDVIHVTPHLPAVGLVAGGVGVPVTVALDAVTRSAKADREGSAPEVAARRHRWLEAQEARVLRAADRVIAMSRWAARGAIGAHGVDPERVTVVPPTPVPVPRRRVPRAPADGGPVRIGFVGNAWRRKGGDRLVAWHQRWWADRAELHVCSAGAPGLAGLTGVVNHGPVPRRRLLEDLLCRFDVLVLPTRADMSPWVITEALAAGVPVVASDIGAIGELVGPGRGGVVCPAGDDGAFVRAVSAVIDDPGLQARMSREAAAAHDSERSLDVVAGRLLEELTSVIVTADRPTGGGR